MTRVCVIGEGMVELSGSAEPGWQLGYGGDTVNMAVHLARFGFDVAFGSALGDDSFSADLRRAWADEGIDTSALLTAPGSMPGLYAIKTDPQGERSFSYWRSDSAARRMFDLRDSARLIETAMAADLLVYSLISLAILPPRGREQLLELCKAVRAKGVRVAFDGNYRPRLWPDTATARAFRDRAIACCDIGLPTLEDEMQLDAEANPGTVAARWRNGGAAETVVKLGAQGCLVDDEIVLPPAKISPVDSSGAGDAFNAGYLAARLKALPPKQAALTGHRLAGWNIGRPGAIPAHTPDAPYKVPG